MSTNRTPRRLPVLGFTLLEATIVLAILALVAVVFASTLMALERGLRLRMAAAELAGCLRLARSYAIRNSVNVGLKFFVAEDRSRVSFALYRDGDGDGVRTVDLLAGRDVEVMPRRDLVHLGRTVGFGFPPGLAPRAPGSSGRRLTRLDDPIRFNRSDIASFSPLGGATPGTLYLTDGYRLAAVRVSYMTGKVEVLLYDRRAERWH